ncbi:MAG: ROK family protein [Coprobacillus sp.]
MNISTTQSLRKINKDKILKALLELGECDKNQLSHYTSLSIGTCNNILKELLESSEVVMGEGFESTGGRKPNSYKLNSNYSKILTISFHKEYRDGYFTSYAMRVYNNVDEVLHETNKKPNVLDFQTLCQDIEEIMKQYDNIKVISISIPGVISQTGHLGEISLVEGFHHFKGIHIVEELNSKFKVKVLIDNDVNVTAIGYYSNHKELSHLGFIYQPLEDLAGAATIVNGQLQRGKHHFVGELSFLPFLTHEQQFEYIKTNEGRIQLLSLFITTMIVMNDPDMICVSCQSLDSVEPLLLEVKKYLPYNQLIPEIVLIGDIDQHIFKGLLEMSHQSLSSHLVMTKQSIFE